MGFKCLSKVTTTKYLARLLCLLNCYQNQLTVMCTTRGERRLIRFRCQKECMEVKSMQRSGTEAIRTQLQTSNLKREITNITNSQNTKRTHGQPSEQLFPKRWPHSNRNRTKDNMNTPKVKRHRNSDTKCKLVISCRMMHNLIKKITTWLRVMSNFIERLRRTNRWMDGFTQRYVHTCGSCNTV